MATEDIFNYLKVDDHISTAGQPTEPQLRDLAADGFTAIINLAPVNPPYTPADEAGIARELGLAYHYIPVDWNNPTDADFDSPADFLARSLGFAALDGERLMGVAYGSLACSRGLEVSLFVDEAYRRQGVATALAGSLLLACLRLGLRPNWDAANPESCALAEKLGYTPAGSYDSYYYRPAS